MQFILSSSNKYDAIMKTLKDLSCEVRSVQLSNSSSLKCKEMDGLSSVQAQKHSNGLTIYI